VRGKAYRKVNREGGKRGRGEKAGRGGGKKAGRESGRRKRCSQDIADTSGMSAR